MFFKKAISSAVSPQDSHQKSGLKNLMANLFLLTIFLLPIVFYPGVVGLASGVKTAFLSGLVVLSLVIFLLNILGTGEIEFPKSGIIPALLMLPVVALISALVSGNVTSSIIGNAFEVGTAGSFIILAAIFFVSVMVGFSDSIIERIIKTFLVSSGIIVLYTFVVALMQSGMLPVISSLPVSLVGSYVDLSILLGSSIVLSLCFLNLHESSTKFKAFLYALILGSIVIIGAVSFKPVIIALLVFSLLIFVYLLSVSRNSHDSNESWISKSYSTLIVLVLSVIMLISGAGISNFLSQALKINSFDVRPNFSSTLSIIKSEWSHNPITGSGPNRFSELWALYKEQNINETDFWNIDFFFGSSLFMTLLATLGALGLLSLLFFFFLFIKNGFRAFFSQIQDGHGARSTKRFFAVSSFLAASFFWLSVIVYSPGIVALASAFIWSGVFVASLRSLGIVQNLRINIFSNPKANFISVFLVVVVMVSSISLEYFILEKFVASVIFNKAVSEFNTDVNIEKAGLAIQKSVSIYPNDLYQRSLSELHLLNIEKIVAGIPQSGVIPDATKTELQNNIAAAIQYADGAIKVDSQNYQNHLLKMRIYESLAVKGISGAAESAKEALLATAKLNPLYPALPMVSARLLAISGDTAGAIKEINKAIELKSNYSDAYFFLAQLEAASNNAQGAIKAVESATLLDPMNAGLYFQLGLLKYQVADYNGAGEAFARAVSVVPDYANAQYFLGLSLYKLGKTNEAISQFEAIKVTNPDNQEVNLILNNLKAGKDPFADAKPPIDKNPEDRSKLPVDDDN